MSNNTNNTPAIHNLTNYFGIKRTVPADLVAETKITGSRSKKNPQVILRRVMVTNTIDKKRRSEFLRAIGEAAQMKCWGYRVEHTSAGTVLNLWWDGRVAEK